MGGPDPATPPPGAPDLVRPRLAIALLSCAVILFEITVTRVLSVVLYYHFAFLALSLAMLGLGAPGVWFALRRPGPRALPRALLAGGVAVPLSLVAVFKLAPVLFAAGSLGRRVLGLGSGAEIVFFVVAIFAPLLCLGSGVCLLLMRAEGRRIGAMYSADLLGAMVGALVVLPLMHVVRTPFILAASAVLPLGAALVCQRPPARAAAAVGIALCACFAWGEPFRLGYTKSYVETERPIFEQWTPTARITAFDRLILSNTPTLPWGWGFGSRFVATPRAHPEMWIEQDGAAGTPIEPLGDEARLRDDLPYDVTTVGYQVSAPRSVCVIGVGGGRDVIGALDAGATAVDGVELNGAILDAFTGPLAGKAIDPYHLPGVRSVVGEGRSFLMRTDRRYDLIQISLVDSWAATAAGAYALSENFLYTVEAFELYWQRLTETGMLSMSRWIDGPERLEAARLALLARAALGRQGVANPEAHLALVSGDWVGTLLVSRQPIGPAMIARLGAVAAQRGFQRHLPPGPDTPRGSLVARVMLDGPGALERLGFDLRPPTDERPFFFQNIDIVRGVSAEAVAALGVNEQSVIILRRLILILAILTLLLFFAPFVARGRLVRGPEFWRGSAYFAAIGLGFMSVEVPWVQRFILYLGHPSYATTVLLAALLLGAGIGSSRAARASLQLLPRVGVLLPLLVLGLNSVLAPVFSVTLAAPLPVRVMITISLVVPVAIPMGFAFPAGMLRFGDENKPWFWAVNGAASVLASVSSLVLALVGGFSDVVLVGVAAYLAAVALLGPARAAAGA